MPYFVRVPYGRPSIRMKSTSGVGIRTPPSLNSRWLGSEIAERFPGTRGRTYASAPNGGGIASNGAQPGQTNRTIAPGAQYPCPGGSDNGNGLGLQGAIGCQPVIAIRANVLKSARDRSLCHPVPRLSGGSQGRH